MVVLFGDMAVLASGHDLVPGSTSGGIVSAGVRWPWLTGLSVTSQGQAEESWGDPVRALVAVFATVGALVGLGVGVLEHQRSTASRTGWTFYLPLNDRYADYLSARRPPWWPGLAGYIGVGLVGGAVVAVVLLALGFRLSRTTHAEKSRVDAS